jgi:hypothetical protein
MGEVSTRHQPTTRIPNPEVPRNGHSINRDLGVTFRDVPNGVCCSGVPAEMAVDLDLRMHPVRHWGSQQDESPRVVLQGLQQRTPQRFLHECMGSGTASVIQTQASSLDLLDQEGEMAAVRWDLTRR